MLCSDYITDQSSKTNSFDVVHNMISINFKTSCLPFTAASKNIPYIILVNFLMSYEKMIVSLLLKYTINVNLSIW